MVLKNNNLKAWLYLLPAIFFLGAFMVYPLIDVFVYSFEEGYNSASQTFFGTGFYNYQYILRDPYFLQAVKNTFILVIITVPVSTGLSLLISVALASIHKLRKLFQTVYFLPYVTNTLAVGLVFMILFKKTAYTDGMVNLLINFFGGPSVDFIDGPYWAKMLVLCIYTVWIVMPFKILILTSALASVDETYYNAAKVDGTSDLKYLLKVMLPICRPTVVTIAILKIIECWNAFVWPRLITTNMDFYLISNGIEQIKTSGFGRADIPAMMAAVVSVSIPLLVLFAIFRKEIMSGVARNGTKG
jgi:multiple sugar transport system permease protein